jgi:hypothetical protein
MNRRAAGSLSLALVVASSGCGVFGTEPEGNRDTHIPSGWSTVDFSPRSYNFGQDHTDVHGGSSSAYITGTESKTETIVGLYQDIRADDYRGKRIRWAGWVRSLNIVTESGLGGQLWFNVYDGVNTGLGRTKSILGTTEWHEVSVVLDVPQGAIGLVLGASLNASGDLLIDDFRLEVVGNDVPTTGSVIPAVDRGPTDLSLYYQQKPVRPLNLDFEGIVQ